MKPIRAQIVPFFVLNHQLDHGHLRQFVRDCAAAGVDGIFMHPREGLLTPYLSEAWFDAIGACIDEAKKRGIQAWIYDEFPYPSGVAGGKVVESDHRFAEKHLRVQHLRLKGGRHVLQPLGSDPVLHAFLSPVRDGKVDRRAAQDVTKHVGPFNDTWILREWDSRYYYAPKYAELYDCPRSSASHPQAMFEADVPAGNWELTVFYVRTGGDYIEPFGHYVDVSNREATQKFIEITHEEYRKRFGRDFGKTIPGFFTDEPKYRNMLPWSDTIAKEWEDYRRDPRVLLALAEKEISWPFPGRGEPRLRLSRLEGLDNADARIRLRYRQTTFQLFRDNWARPISDWCGRHGVKFTGHISPEEEWVQEAAICGSVFQLLKTFHIPGCDLIIPAVGDRKHAILNFIPALPASVAAQQGKPHVLCEVYGANNYPINMQWKKMIGEWLAMNGVNLFTTHSLFGWIDGYRKYDAPPTFYKPSTLWPHYGDWAKHIRATATRLGPLGIRVSVVIVRPMRTLWRLGLDRLPEARAIYERAMQLILHLAERGIAFHYVDDVDLNTAQVRGDSIQLGKARYPMLVHIDGTLDGESLAALRKLKQRGARVLTDADAERLPGPLVCKTGGVRVTQSRDKSWFCLNITPVAQTFALNGETHRLEGFESRWLKPLEKSRAPKPIARTMTLPSRWRMRPATDNVVVLSNWTLNGKRTKLNPYFESAAAGEVDGWDQVSLGKIPTNPALPKPKRLVYRTQFRVAGVRDVALVLEGETIRGKWTATLNGRPLKNWKRNYRFEPTNIECDLRSALRRGLNRLEFVVTIDKSSDGMIEPCRLYGQFRVAKADGVPSLVAGAEVTGSGDWCKLGFPHFSGTLVHKQNFRWAKREGERVELTLSRPPSDHVVVMLNGRKAGKLLWSPWRLDLTRALRDGANELELHVSNTLTNLMYARPRPSGLNGTVKLIVRRSRSR